MIDPFIVGSTIVGVAIVIAAWMLSKKYDPSGVGPEVRDFPLSLDGVPVEPSGIPVTSGTRLEVGSPVLAFEQDRWWRADVIAIEPNDMVRIRFPGWDKKWDWSVPRNSLQVDPRRASHLTPPESREST